MGTGTGLQDMGGAIQVVSTKVGLVLLVLGVTHFLNLLMFSRMRWRVRLVAPQGLENLARPVEQQEYSTVADEPGLQDYRR